MLDPEALLEAVAEAFVALSSGGFDAPPRQAVRAEGGSVLTMAGRRAGSPVAVKLVGVFPGNVELGLDPHPAVICLFDATTGRCLALMDGEAITALRTAAGSALSVRALARADARVLAVVGSGVQARAHLRMLPLVRPFSDVRLVARDPAAAERLGVAAGSVEGADVDLPHDLVLVARAVRGRCRAGRARHLGRLRAAGRRARPVRWPRAARLFVETRQAFAPPPAGCAELAGLDPSSGTELGEVLAGRAPGRSGDDEITVYKAMGHVAEDAAAAELVYRAALEAGVGRDVEV